MVANRLWEDFGGVESSGGGGFGSGFTTIGGGGTPEQRVQQFSDLMMITLPTVAVSMLMLGGAFTLYEPPA